MLLTPREEKLLKAFLNYGKLSMDNIIDELKVSKRTVYRTLADLSQSLSAAQITIDKINGRYELIGDVENLSSLTVQTSYSPKERLLYLTYLLLVSEQELINDQLQDRLGVSNVTIINDMTLVEQRLATFGYGLIRRKGYRLEGQAPLLDRRQLLAVVLAQSISLDQLRHQAVEEYDILDLEQFRYASEVIHQFKDDLLNIDSKMEEFFIILLTLSHWQKSEPKNKMVSKTALELSQKIYGQYAKLTKCFFTINDILYYASLLDELLFTRQETPLFTEKFDSEFYYNISNLIDKVSLYTKINFIKDPSLFQFLFHHIRLSLTIPTLFEETQTNKITHEVVRANDYLHRVVSLLVKDIFPSYLQSESEYEYITLHFASSLRRSPDIYPVHLLILTDERPLLRELLMTRIKTIAPFVEVIESKSPRRLEAEDWERYDAILSTSLVTDEGVKHLSLYPDAEETQALQTYLQEVQENRVIKLRQDSRQLRIYDSSQYLVASQSLLSHFIYQELDNSSTFQETIAEVIEFLPHIKDKQHLANKLTNRFKISPMAIPETHLALLHTYSSQVTESYFAVVELKNPVMAQSMNHTDEEVHRILVMLTKAEETEEIRKLMTAISQSIIENHLYTEIYKTGNKEIIYHLLNQIFTDKIKKLEK